MHQTLGKKKAYFYIIKKGSFLTLSYNLYYYLSGFSCFWSSFCDSKILIHPMFKHRQNRTTLVGFQTQLSHISSITRKLTLFFYFPFFPLYQDLYVSFVSLSLSFFFFFLFFLICNFLTSLITCALRVQLGNWKSKKKYRKIK